ncbi:serine/threonine-protein kinase AFC1-like [Olea europaea var. sylvestris]|uniref:serine/threonine-protein kinase AFC1-like n=1 Tax=Olea europaea var. sylvestris TaxID=158386 RepID=UPI000C1CD81A|nr:serine/threonine-protein kinase AFC1-like [Olea europaea var. sylvestris]
METPRVVDFHHKSTDKRPRKRPRLTWDMPPALPPDHPKILPTLYLGKELGPVTNYAYSSIYYKGVPHNGSPPWRSDDKDGHYAFAIGENLTSRCKCTSSFRACSSNTFAVIACALCYTYVSSVNYAVTPPLQQTNLDVVICKPYCSTRVVDSTLTCLMFLMINVSPPPPLIAGTFGQVLECLDNEKKEIVAIKIVRSIRKYREAAMIEINVLQKLARHDVRGTRCVQIRNWFDYRNHICIVFEKLGPSLYDFLRKNSYRSFPIDLVREFGRQLLESVAFMHDLRLIHTDLKPENILLVSSEYIKVPDYKFLSRSTKNATYFKNLPKSSSIKLIDFGSTTFEHQDHNYVVSTRHYRAPEVILGLGWNYPCDMWSIGCILIELCTGDALFQTHENLEHLAMMERVLGPLPQHMMMQADRQAEKYFRRGAKLDWPEGATSRESMRAVWKLPCLQNLIMQHVDHSAGDLINLLQGLLRYDPAERLKAREALSHPFFIRDLRRGFYPF